LKLYVQLARFAAHEKQGVHLLVSSEAVSKSSLNFNDQVFPESAVIGGLTVPGLVTFATNLIALLLLAVPSETGDNNVDPASASSDETGVTALVNTSEPMPTTANSKSNATHL
jgi:hypothetical protein